MFYNTCVSKDGIISQDTAVQNQKPVTAYLESKQLPSGFTEQYNTVIIHPNIERQINNLHIGPTTLLFAFVSSPFRSYIFFGFHRQHSLIEDLSIKFQSNSEWIS